MYSTRYTCPISMKPELSKQIFEKFSNTKFHENPSGGSPVVPCGRTVGRTDGQTDMTKLIDAFRKFANASKIQQSVRREETVKNGYVGG